MGFMIEIQLKDKCIMIGKFTAVEVGMFGTLSTMALKMNPMLFINGELERYHFINCRLGHQREMVGQVIQELD